MYWIELAYLVAYRLLTHSGSLLMSDNGKELTLVAYILCAIF